MLRIFRNGICLVAAALSLPGCNPFGDALVAACESVIKKRLRSPSTYVKIEVQSSEEKLGEIMVIAYLTEKNGYPKESRERQLLQFKQGKIKPTLYRVYLTSDAANVYGTPIRSVDECTYFSVKGDKSDASEWAIKINGKSRTEWLLSKD